MTLSKSSLAALFADSAVPVCSLLVVVTVSITLLLRHLVSWKLQMKFLNSSIVYISHLSC